MPINFIPAFLRSLPSNGHLFTALLPILFSFSIILPVAAQNKTRKCHTMEADAHLRAQYPQMGTLQDFEDWLAPRLRTYEQAGGARAVSNIPVIFHIIHDGDAVGTGDNIASSYINAQIQQLNNDFRRILNTSGYNTDPVGADSEIEFCAALVDPNGNTLAEAGINRIDRNSMGWSAPPYGDCINDEFDETYIETTMKPQSQWDPTQYLNVWIMDISCGILGYAQFPNNSGLSGFGSNNGTASTDGVVLLSTSIGSTDLPFPGGDPYNEGRTATHEIGHFFGLRHIWGDQDCGNDYCNDTPQAEGPASGCPDNTTCDGNRDMVENYMDYSYDACMNIFTADQKARMQTVLLNSPRRGSLTNSTACQNSGSGGLSCATTITSFPYAESFETGLGTWSQSAADDFDWTRNSGGTPSSNTGPSAAAAGSWYVFMESSSPNYSNKVSILTGPCFDLSAASTAEFSFQYHLYGDTNMGGLELQASTDGQAWTNLWSVSGNQGNAWHTASVDLTAYAGSIVKLQFKGTTGSTWQGDTAVDDLKLTSDVGSTGGGCTNSISSFPYAESWESNFGAWTQESGDDFDWIRLSGSTPSGSTGPGAAIDGIYYAYIESSSPNYSNKTAILNGPCFDLSTADEATFSFQYHMYGAVTMGSLTLEVRPDGGNWTSIWTRSGNQDSYWHGASIGLNSYLGTTVELRFVGITGDTWQGDMAIDDLALTTTGGGTGACTDIRLSLTFDDYPEETSWEITDNNGTVLYQGGPYGNQADGSTIQLTGCLPDGCYNFIIYDKYGDGMCCNYGNGSYTFSTSDGTVLASGSSYGFSETTSFCLSASGARANVKIDHGQMRQILEAFPNPAREQLTIRYESKADSEVIWRIVDLLGQTLESEKWDISAGINQQQIRVDQLPAGTYLLIIEHNGQPTTRRFVVNH
ncbi:MAG: M43 family zinc metalloprotease [Saprospiraceae bacterium]|nr:T9SS type A sorting domain-containing protein [Lewinella sp.]